MTETKNNEIRATPEAAVSAAQEASGLIMRSNGTTFIVGLHFSETSKDTLEDKVKKLIRKDVETENF